MSKFGELINTQLPVLIDFYTEWNKVRWFGDNLVSLMLIQLLAWFKTKFKIKKKQFPYIYYTKNKKYHPIFQ